MRNACNSWRPWCDRCSAIAALAVGGEYRSLTLLVVENPYSTRLNPIAVLWAENNSADGGAHWATDADSVDR